MAELVEKLGVDWRLLLSQAVNFLVLLAVLRHFAYKPLLKMLKERRVKIEEGLAKAEEAETRLLEVDEISKGRMKATEAEAMAMMRSTEEKSKKAEAAMLDEARKKEAAMLAGAELAAKAKEEAAMAKLRIEAAEIVKQAIIRTVELDPKAIDEALVRKAVSEIARTS